jgi:putative hemolysin
VQVGITLIGIISGAYGGAALTDDMELFLSRWPSLIPYTHTIALALVIGSITYFTIVVGELVPKTIALSNPEGIALTSGPSSGCSPWSRTPSSSCYRCPHR